MRHYLLISILCLQAMMGSASDVRHLYAKLDSLIAHYQETTAEKESRIRNLKDGVKTMALTDDQTYDLNLRLYDEYVAFRFDSAFYYVERM